MSAVLVLAVAALLLAGTASGQVPEKMNYQVMLTNDSDEPLADQAVTLVFRIYNSDIGGVMLWTETHVTATNSIGVVSVVLGTTTPFSPTLFHQPLWVEVEVDTETLTPRRELVSSPYALHASDSDKLGLIAASDYALEEDLGTPGTINDPLNPVDWTMLKNVPAGFADGADDVGGAGDGHSLDADDGSPVDAVYVSSEGVLEFGSSTSDGVAEFYASGGASPSIQLDGDWAGNGGSVELYEEDGTRYGYLEPDFTGTGGFLGITNGSGSDAFIVNGNYTGQNAYVGIFGSVSSSGFNTNVAGNGSVMLPASAVSASEILDEPGVAGASATAMTELSGPLETLLSRTITVPAAGYVLVAASAEIEIHHGATFSSAYFGVSNSSSSFPSGGAMYHRVPAGATEGVWMPGVSVQWLFPVSAGANTFYFLADVVGGTWRVLDRNLTLAYFPTAYGTVSRTVAAPPENPEQRTAEPGYALTEADIAAERAESEAANNARIERELAEMEARIEQIRAHMGNGNEQ